MRELITANLTAYVIVALITGFVLLSIIYTIFDKTKGIESNKKKRCVRFSISGAFVGLWIWYFVYVNLFPISMAYYEYNHNVCDEKIGVIESIERSEKDRIDITIDGTEYAMVYSSENPIIIVGKDIGEGDTVKFVFGVKSRYIFDMYRLNAVS